MNPLAAVAAVTLVLGLSVLASAGDMPPVQPQEWKFSAPPWRGEKSGERRYYQTWYACTREAEQTVPAMNVQASGDYAGMAVLNAALARQAAVWNLSLACLRSFGYNYPVNDAPTSTPPTQKPLPDTVDPREPKR